MLTRRDVLRVIAGTGMTAAMPLDRDPAPSAPHFGLAFTSFVVRYLQGRDIFRTDGARLTALDFFGLCRRFDARVGQVDLSQFASTEPASLAELKRWIDDRGLVAELSIPARTLESEQAFEQAAAVAHGIGATRLRVALLSGRRYDAFTTHGEWVAFADRWQRALPGIKPAVERSGLQLGIENHKDWTALELAELLDRLDSPAMGACVDFGNNMAFLEDAMHVAETLAPWAVTTHLKDMAVARHERGFELSEVPLGDGLLPLADMIAVLRRARPDVHFCLEMITRDPLLVPYKEEGYWVPFGPRDQRRVVEFERRVMARASADLPRVSHLPPGEQIAAEDENVRRSEAYARGVLGLQGGSIEV